MNSYKNITTIIFDLGGVLITIEPELTFKTLASYDYSGPSLGQRTEELIHHQAIHDFESGRISPAVFHKNVCSFLGKQIPGPEFWEIWNNILGSYHAELPAFLTMLSNKYNLYLLSNTNEIHIKTFLKIFSNKFNGKELSDFFIKTYYSNEIGYLKPELEIYRYVIEKENINPKQALFIDDKQENIAGASNIGLQTYLHQRNTSIIEPLQTMMNL